jgi:hypothetical protein
MASSPFIYSNRKMKSAWDEYLVSSRAAAATKKPETKAKIK